MNKCQVYFYEAGSLAPAVGFWHRIRRGILQLVCRRYVHCGLVVGGLWEVTEAGYGFVPEEEMKAPDAILEVEQVKPISYDDRGWYKTRCVLGWFFPARFDTCSSFVGRHVGVPGARTPDELYFRIRRDVLGQTPFTPRQIKAVLAAKAQVESLRAKKKESDSQEGEK